MKTRSQTRRSFQDHRSGKIRGTSADFSPESFKETKSLEECFHLVNEHHEQYQASEHSALWAYNAMGRYLNDSKKFIKGQGSEKRWLKSLKSRAPEISERKAQECMYINREYEMWKDLLETGETLSVNKVLKHLRGESDGDGEREQPRTAAKILAKLVIEGVEELPEETKTPLEQRLTDGENDPPWQTELVNRIRFAIEEFCNETEKD